MKKASEGFHRKKLRVCENPGKCLNFSALFFFISISGARNRVECRKKGVFDVLMKDFFCRKIINVIFGIQEAQCVLNITLVVVFFQILT